MDTLTPQTLRIPVPSRYGSSELDGHLFHPEDTARAVLTIHPATATPERFYFFFAEAAAARGFAVVTYGFRGVGDRATARAHRHIRMRDWISEDVAAAGAWAETTFPDLPQVALGHSVGGHALLLGYGGERLSGIVTVASAMVAARKIAPRSERFRVEVGLGVFGRAATRVLGYMPGSRVGLGEDLPAAALYEWTSWLRRPHFFFDDPSFSAEAHISRLRTPVLAVGTSDDPWATDAFIDALTDRLRLAPLTRRTFTPDELGVRTIGHHGLLRRSVAEAAWPDIVDWLDTAAGVSD
ncbi:alpha/beta hydrolase family protein [Brevibacterium spongiae]|uniref:Alpha/beta fold hydrolase n=1 Tax=Brevibacterium spongiae TaxID=2909672 RepID=A0ABY5SN65_9MICO|nr:alpha/beta fold hydrolase [Brevibacterium spongiae]UVI35917.1 alpha/beta fold hydrolase [Brevibacterium spongiae]